ncbi:MAG: PKD domain-containing protein [Flavobacteriales bacterium]
MKFIKYILIAIPFILSVEESKGQCDASISYTTNLLSVNFSSLSTGITAYGWDFGDGNFSSTGAPSHTYATAGIYKVTHLVQAAGCSDTSEYWVAVNAGPCSVRTLLSTDATTGLSQKMFFDGTGSNPTTTYLFHFGDGQTSTAQWNRHIYSSVDNYHVSLIATDTSGCSSSDISMVRVNCNLIASYKDSVVGLSHYLTSTSTGTNPNFSYFWDFGDGNSSVLENPVHTYTNPGNYQIMLMVTGGGTGPYCMDSTSAPSISSSACPWSASFIENSNGLTTNFVNTSTGTTPTTDYFWQFGDATSSMNPNPTHTYTAPGTYTVTLFVSDTVGGFCQDSSTMQITVNNTNCPINASFTETISGNTATFTSTSSGLSGSATYNWLFSDGATLLGSATGFTTSYTFPSQSIYTVSLIVSDSICSDSTFKRVAISAHVFTPNGDGIDDVVVLPCSGNGAAIYNSNGILVETLAPATASWDGTNNQGGNEPTGLYFILCTGSSTPVQVTLIR